MFKASTGPIFFSLDRSKSRESFFTQASCVCHAKGRSHLFTRDNKRLFLLQRSLREVCNQGAVFEVCKIMGAMCFSANSLGSYLESRQFF